MSSVILIGMPGAGKSTIGVLLAKKLTMNFVDTDLLIQLAARQPLQDIVNRQGYLRLRELEEQVLLSADLSNRVVATGGSAVYSEAAMQRLTELGPVIYLQVGMAEIAHRLGDFAARGIACAPGHKLADIYAERVPLYERYAALTVDCEDKSKEQIVDEIAQRLKK